jgi:hypothetical protein
VKNTSSAVELFVETGSFSEELISFSSAKSGLVSKVVNPEKNASVVICCSVVNTFFEVVFVVAAVGDFVEIVSVVVDCVEISGPVERVSVKVAFVAACVKTSVSVVGSIAEAVFVVVPCVEKSGSINDNSSHQ